MKVTCQVCKREEVRVLPTGKLENHYPSPKVDLSPKGFCKNSGNQLVSAEHFTCPQCGREQVDITDDGRFIHHYPLNGWGGAKRSCVGSNEIKANLPKEELSYNDKLRPQGRARYSGPRGILRD